MKKVLCILLVIFSFVSVLNATEYECSISGSESIKSNSQDYSYLNIDISNIENISSLRMYIKFDDKLYSTNKCKFLDYANTCDIAVSDSGSVYYNYSYNKDYSLNDYPFYYISFISNENTPSEGNTKISVYFEDAKDINNKDISIKGCEKELYFEDGNSQTTISYEDLNIKIKDFDFDFDKDTYEYNLYVDSEINSLDIEVQAPDDYTYFVSGATDLNSFGNKVLITVSNSENEYTYTINVNREKEEFIPTDIKGEISSVVKKANIKTYYPYILIPLIIIVLIVIIVKKINNKKMDKYLDNL